jgi:penicillin amidase
VSRRSVLRWGGAGTVLLLVVGLVVSVALVTAAVRRPLPDRDGEVDVAGLSADVEVLRDAQGVPHVYADTAEDLFRAQGYVHAQDRFFEMDLRRHITAGRLSELVGADEEAMQADVVVRTLGWRRTAEAEMDLLDADTVAYLEAYAEGVNAYLEGRSPGELSLAYTVLGLQLPEAQIEPWTPVDSVSWLKALAWDLRSNYTEELGRGLLLARGETPARVAQLYPEYPAGNPVIVPDEMLAQAPAARALPRTPAGAEQVLAGTLAGLQQAGPLLAGTAEGLGSNSWVVSGEHTASGAPLLANDPHLAPASPSTWHQVGLHCRRVDERCPFDVAGFSFSGMPGVFIGRNADVAWGLTTLYADHTDFVVEKVVGEEYERDGQMLPLRTREEVVEVAGGEPVTVTVRETEDGPLLSDVLLPLAALGRGFPVPAGSPGRGPGYAVSLRWTATEPGRTMDAVFAIDRARSARKSSRAPACSTSPARTSSSPSRGRAARSATWCPAASPSGAGRRHGPGPRLDLGLRLDRVPARREPPRRRGPGAGLGGDGEQPGHPSGVGALPGHRHRPRLPRRPDRGGAGRARRGGRRPGGRPGPPAAGRRQPFAETLVPYLLDVDGVDDFTADGVQLLHGWTARRVSTPARPPTTTRSGSSCSRRPSTTSCRPSCAPTAAPAGSRWSDSCCRTRTTRGGTT